MAKKLSIPKIDINFATYLKLISTINNFNIATTMNASIENFRTLLANLKTMANNAVAILPGEGWQALEVESNRIVIAIVDPETGEAIPGHQFVISYRPAIIDEEDALNVNIGTMGSFDPSKDATRTQLYMGFAKMVSDLKLQEAIKSSMREIAEMRNEMMK